MKTDKIVIDTLFIDMKYLILYHKLGFQEVSPDLYIKHYPDCSIRIDSEEQLFSYKGCSYPLLDHKDFVILECLDRLLGQGYRSNEVKLTESTSDITLKQNDTIRLNIICEQWGDDFDNRRASFSPNGVLPSVIYTSKLSGGLIDWISSIWFGESEYMHGIFDEGCTSFSFSKSSCWNVKSSQEYPVEFIVINDVLIKYSGSDQHVRIPDGIIKIESGAFWNCSFLQSAYLPETVISIGGDAFVYCENLERVNIPVSVREMGDDPFAGCLNLDIQNNSQAFILEEGVLFDREKKILIHYASHNTRSSYTIPETVEWLGKHSFYNCKNLKKLIITENVNFMGNNPFSDCENLILENRSPFFVYENGALLNREKTLLMHYSMAADTAIYHIPHTVRTVGRNAFWNCHKLKKIIIPSNVRQLGYNPFSHCRNLTLENHSPFYAERNGVLYDRGYKELICCTNVAAQDGVHLPDTLLSIGRNSFSGCESLKSITIPDSVRSISRGAFSNCTNLEEVILPVNLESIGEWAFNNCERLKRIEMGQGTKIAINTFMGTETVVVRR